MLRCISQPSQLRRRIAMLARLSQMNSRFVNLPGLGELQEAVEDIRMELVDTACSVLQGSLPGEAADQMKDLLKRLEQTVQTSAYSSTLHFKLSEIRRQVDPMILLCEDPQFPEALTSERTPIASYLHQSETVLLANGSLMAESFRLFLESFGIQCILGRESAGVVYGLTVGPLGEVDVNVSPENAIDAKILLSAMQNGYFIRPEDADEALADDDDLFESEWDDEDAEDLTDQEDSQD